MSRSPLSPFRTTRWMAFLFIACSSALAQSDDSLDVVLSGGRVMDPETGLDAIRHVGIREDRIVAISVDPLTDRLRDGGVLVDAEGLVVAPGFIDLHAHGQSDRAFQYRAKDGVTTALELEWGYPRIGAWLKSRTGKARIHYGASVSHGLLRALVMPRIGDSIRAANPGLETAAGADEPLIAIRSFAALSDANNRDLQESLIDELFAELDRGLKEGGLGIGVAHQYYPGASHREILRVFQFAGKRKAPIYVHVREMHISAMQEVIANAAATGAPLHIVHVNSMSGSALPEVLELIRGAQEHGLDVTTEAYPYTAASTGLHSAIFDEGWQERLGISYDALQWQDTGERLTKETFERYRAQGGVVIIHFMKEEMIQLALRTPFVMVASDAMPFAPGAHPRSAGTFARFLGRYVRDQGIIDLMTAIRKVTLMPAVRLENIAPSMRKKGRVQVGADADLTVFDPQSVLDKATFESTMNMSVGIPHVLVSGAFVVRDGELVEGTFPGRPVLGRYAER